MPLAPTPSLNAAWRKSSKMGGKRGQGRAVSSDRHLLYRPASTCSRKPHLVINPRIANSSLQLAGAYIRRRSHCDYSDRCSSWRHLWRSSPHTIFGAVPQCCPFHSLSFSLCTSYIFDLSTWCPAVGSKRAVPQTGWGGGGCNAATSVTLCTC